MAEKFITTIERKDFESGELKRISKEQTYKTEEPDYVKLYIEAWCVFKEIKGINNTLLYEILPYMSYAKNGQRIFLNSALKREIAEKLGWSDKTALARFGNEITKLCKAQILKRTGTSTYAVNPELIGKGHWSEIKALRATFNLETGKVSCEYDPEQDMFAM